MSKNLKQEEEEWEDVEEGEEEEEEEEDTSIQNSDVVVKYKKAAQWVNDTVKEVLDLCKPGAKVVDICVKGDEIMREKVKLQFKCDKGICIPTTLNVNNCVTGYSPAPGEEATPLVLAINDVVKVDLGIHVDGYPVVVAQTIVVTEDGKCPTESPQANLIGAAYHALQTATRSFRPEKHNYDVTEILEKTAELYGVNPVEGALSHLMKRYIIDGFRVVASKKVPEHLVYQYDFEKFQVWTLDVVFSTGKGQKLKEKDFKTSIYKVNIESEYMPKLDAARQLNGEIEKNFATFPFAMRNVENKKARLGMSEFLKHNAYVPYPALYEKEGEIVAQFKSTILIGNKKIERITGIAPQEGITTKAYTDEALIAASKLPLSLAEKKQKE